MAYNQNLKIDSIMGIDYSERLFGIVFSDIRLEFLERHTYFKEIMLTFRENMRFIESMRLTVNVMKANVLPKRSRRN